MKQKSFPVLVRLLPLLLLISLTGCMGIEGGGSGGNGGSVGTAEISPLVGQWRPNVVYYADMYGIPEQVELLLAMIAQESGGDSQKTPDIMQSSESAGLPPNSIPDPIQSIEQGIKYFSEIIKSGLDSKVDLDTILQSYNFGGEFVSYIKENYNGQYQPEAAKAFSEMMCQRLGWSNYGDALYVEHVKRYLVSNSTVNGIDNFSVLEAKMKEYIGVPYLLGGNTKDGIDCSGLTKVCYAAIQKTLYRTAQEQYDHAIPIKKAEMKPGDLVFFTRTNNKSSNYVTHVGIITGNNQMFDASSKGCGYTSLSLPYYVERVVGYGRVR